VLCKTKKDPIGTCYEIVSQIYFISSASQSQDFVKASFVYKGKGLNLMIEIIVIHHIRDSLNIIFPEPNNEYYIIAQELLIKLEKIVFADIFPEIYETD